jgi:hypothetical protein
VKFQLPTPEILAAESIEAEDPLAFDEKLLSLLRSRRVKGLATGLGGERTQTQ